VPVEIVRADIDPVKPEWALAAQMMEMEVSQLMAAL
jgi:hypothetical protein